MAAARLLISSGIVAQALATKAFVYVASGGCDGADKGCVPDPDSEATIVLLEVDEEGHMMYSLDEHATTKASHADGSGHPNWLTTVGSRTGGDDCMIATLGDTSEILTYRPGQSTMQYTPSGGVAPVYAAVMEDGHTLGVANYHGPDNANTSTGASVATFSIDRKDCSLTLLDVKNHSGSSVNPQRQGGAHVHSVVPGKGPWGKFLFACDLGMDKVFMYNVSSQGKLSELFVAKAPAGSGPRHLVQNPHYPQLYVVDEMGESVLVYSNMKLVQTLPLNLKKPECDGLLSKSAEIVISPDGAMVFATNRGCQNTVTSFKVTCDKLVPGTKVCDELSLVQQEVVEAPRFPRGMYLTQSGSVLLVAGQSQTEVWSYTIDKAGGMHKAHEIKGSKLPAHPATFTSFASEMHNVVIV